MLRSVSRDPKTFDSACRMAFGVRKPSNSVCVTVRPTLRGTVSFTPPDPPLVAVPVDPVDPDVPVEPVPVPVVPVPVVPVPPVPVPPTPVFPVPVVPVPPVPVTPDDAAEPALARKASECWKPTLLLALTLGRYPELAMGTFSSIARVLARWALSWGLLT